MIYIWIISTFILLILFISLLIYHLYYRANVRNITTILNELEKEPDTNRLLTVIADQKDINKLASSINCVLGDVRRSQIQLNNLNRNFRQSITNISHDIRTPLTTASGYVQMLQADVSEKEREEYISIILERQNMVRTLLEQLFEYVRIESGEITYEQVPVDAKNVFLETIALYYEDFNRKGMEPAIEYPEQSCMITGDEKGLKRIFSNILYNALLHGSGDYAFSIEKTDTQIVCTFSNKSELMSTTELDNIFERFYTGDKSRNKKTTGLGLAIAKEITRKFGGDIQAGYRSGRFYIWVVF
jgi:signal transduction histidine kinase